MATRSNLAENLRHNNIRVLTPTDWTALISPNPADFFATLEVDGTPITVRLDGPSRTARIIAPDTLWPTDNSQKEDLAGEIFDVMAHAALDQGVRIGPQGGTRTDWHGTANFIPPAPGIFARPVLELQNVTYVLEDARGPAGEKNLRNFIQNDRVSDAVERLRTRVSGAYDGIIKNTRSIEYARGLWEGGESRPEIERMLRLHLGATGEHHINPAQIPETIRQTMETVVKEGSKEDRAKAVIRNYGLSARVAAIPAGEKSNPEQTRRSVDRLIRNINRTGRLNWSNDEINEVVKGLIAEGNEGISLDPEATADIFKTLPASKTLSKWLLAGGVLGATTAAVGTYVAFRATKGSLSLAGEEWKNLKDHTPKLASAVVNTPLNFAKRGWEAAKAPFTSSYDLAKAGVNYVGKPHYAEKGVGRLLNGPKSLWYGLKAGLAGLGGGVAGLVKGTVQAPIDFALEGVAGVKSPFDNKAEAPKGGIWPMLKETAGLGKGALVDAPSAWWNKAPVALAKPEAAAPAVEGSKHNKTELVADVVGATTAAFAVLKAVRESKLTTEQLGNLSAEIADALNLPALQVMTYPMTYLLEKIVGGLPKKEDELATLEAKMDQLNESIEALKMGKNNDYPGAEAICKQFSSMQMWMGFSKMYSRKTFESALKNKKDHAALKTQFEKLYGDTSNQSPEEIQRRAADLLSRLNIAITKDTPPRLERKAFGDAEANKVAEFLALAIYNSSRWFTAEVKNKLHAEADKKVEITWDKFGEQIAGFKLQEERTAYFKSYDQADFGQEFAEFASEADIDMAMRDDREGVKTKIYRLYGFPHQKISAGLLASRTAYLISRLGDRSKLAASEQAKYDTLIARLNDVRNWLSAVTPPATENRLDRLFREPVKTKIEYARFGEMIGSEVSDAESAAAFLRGFKLTDFRREFQVLRSPAQFDGLLARRGASVTQLGAKIHQFLGMSGGAVTPAGVTAAINDFINNFAAPIVPTAWTGDLATKHAALLADLRAIEAVLNGTVTIGGVAQARVELAT